MPCKSEARHLQIFLFSKCLFSFFHIFTSFLSISLSLFTTSCGTAAPKKQADVEMLRWEGLSGGTAWLKNLVSNCTMGKGGSLRDTHPGYLLYLHDLWILPFWGLMLPLCHPQPSVGANLQWNTCRRLSTQEHVTVFTVFRNHEG